MLLGELGERSTLCEFFVDSLEQFFRRCFYLGFLFIGNVVREFFQDVPRSDGFHRCEFARILVVIRLHIRFGDVIGGSHFDKPDLHLFFSLIGVPVLLEVRFRFSIVNFDGCGVIGVLEFDELQFRLVRLGPKILFHFSICHQFQVLDVIAQCRCAELQANVLCVTLRFPELLVEVILLH